MTVYGQREHAVVELEAEEIAEHIREMGERTPVYVCAYPPQWNDDKCKRFMAVVSEWIEAGQVPPRPV